MGIIAGLAIPLILGFFVIIGRLFGDPTPKEKEDGTSLLTGCFMFIVAGGLILVFIFLALVGG